MRLRTLSGGLALATGLAVLWLWLGSRSTTVQVPAAQVYIPPPGPLGEGLRMPMVGSMSCSGRACHGGVEPARTADASSYATRVGCEFTLWISDDPHVKAYTVLFDERSRRMEKNLKGLARLEDAHPEKNALCLRCHGPEALWMQQHPEQQQALSDGFGCESCHGPAGGWLAPHTASKKWKSLPRRVWLNKGMWPMSDLRVRAAVCSECHVGSKERDVDHDLIAAGHPRLNFEFSTYLSLLPKHWRKDRDAGPDFEARAWIIGQAVSAQAALELLGERASSAKRPWPEFAEYDCYACHHDLQADSWRQHRGYKGHVPGALPWSEWYYAMPRVLAGKASPAANPKLLDTLAALDKEMRKPYPDRMTVAKQAQAAATALKDWKAPPATWLPQALQQGERLYSIPSLGAGGKPGPLEIASWDVAAQLGYAAWSDAANVTGSAKPKLSNPEVAAALKALFEQLQMPVGKGSISDSPHDFSRRTFIKQLQSVQKLLNAPAGP